MSHTIPDTLWKEGLSPGCSHFQLDLSCLVDGELDGHAASRAIAHLEGCPSCREFFDDARMQVRLHLDMADPDRLLDRFQRLTGTELADEVEAVELVDRLATIFYQIGKAYVLTAIDPGFRTRVFERAVQVESERARGRGFIDGVVDSGRGSTGGVDWQGARHALNGQLSKIEGALDKGKRLLEEALAVDPEHEEARLYMAFVQVHEGKALRAAGEFRRIFDTAISEVNRAHAAVQLARLYSREGELKKAIAFLRWVTMSGIADHEERFFFVRFNIGMHYAHLAGSAGGALMQRRSLESFRELLDRHPDRASEVAGFFARSPRLRLAIDARPGFTDQLLEQCPELFSGASDPTTETTSEPSSSDPAGDESEPDAK